MFDKVKIDLGTKTGFLMGVDHAIFINFDILN